MKTATRKLSIGDQQYDEDRGIHYPHTPPTERQVKIHAAIATLAALAEAIRELGSVPSGHLYASVMCHMDAATYESFISRLIGAGLVERKPSHELVWIGPALESK